VSTESSDGRAEQQARQRKRSWQIFGGVASVAALLATLTTLIDWSAKTLDEPAPPPAARIDTRISNVALRDRQMPLVDYLNSTSQSTSGLTRAELREPGLVFSVAVRLRGGVDESFPLVWTLHRQGSGAPLRAPIYNQPASVTFTPRARDHSRAWPIWVPYPPSSGTFFLRATLTNERQEPVDERESEPFLVAEIPG
jgi:hypothetical protein